MCSICMYISKEIVFIKAKKNWILYRKLKYAYHRIIFYTNESVFLLLLV